MEVHTKINLTFGRGLRTILRADPEAILVGEVLATRRRRRSQSRLR